MVEQSANKYLLMDQFYSIRTVLFYYDGAGFCSIQAVHRFKG